MTTLRATLCVALCSLGLFGQGCATILHGTTQEVSINSDPAGARVDIDRESVGTTPCSVELKRGDNHVVAISMEGYYTEEVAVMKVMSGAVAGNILAGGIIGWGIDAASGAQYRLVPEVVSVTLRPLAPGDSIAAAPHTDALSPSSRLRQLEGLHDDGLVTDDEYSTVRKSILAEMSGEAP